MTVLTPEGVIPQPSVERLQIIGKWLKVNGESIYGSSASPFEKPDWGRYTQQGNVLYAHVFDWPASNKLILPRMTDGAPYKRIQLVATGEELEFGEVEDAFMISLPNEAPDPVASVLRLTY